MDNDKIVSILKECIPSDMDKSDLEKISNQLRNVIKDKLNLVNVDLGLLKKYIDVSEEDYEELSFYTIMCDLQNTDYKLVDEQISRIEEIINKYLNDVVVKIHLIDQENDKNKYIVNLIDKISKKDYILTNEEMLFINTLLKNNKVSIDTINQIIIGLALVTLKKIEKKLNISNDNIKEENMSLDNYISYLEKILVKYNYSELHDVLINNVDYLVHNAKLDNIENIISTLNNLNINLNVGDTNGLRIIRLFSYSSSQVIKDVINITSELMGMSNQDSFNHLFSHIAVFVSDGVASAYQDYMNNMRLFKAIGYTKDEFRDIKVGVLCENSKKIRKNVLLMEKYNIPRNKYLIAETLLKTSYNLGEEIDIWIELGDKEIDKYLNNNLLMLIYNKSDNLGLKLRVFKDLGKNILDSLNKKTFKESEFINNNVINIDGNNYKFDFIPYKNNNEYYDKLMSKRLLDLLDDKASNSNLYKKFVDNIECVNDLYYIIPGVNIRISKNKVFRVFNNLISNGVTEDREMLIYAITYNSIISEDEYDIICEFVDKILEVNLEHRGGIR